MKAGKEKTKCLLYVAGKGIVKTSVHIQVKGEKKSLQLEIIAKKIVREKKLSAEVRKGRCPSKSKK